MNYIEEYKKIFNGENFIRDGITINASTFRPFDGASSRSLYTGILNELESRDSVTVLDFGCGEAIQWHEQCLSNKTKSLPNLLGKKLQGFYRYDPANTIYSKKPTTKFDFIICADVMEHIPEESIISTIQEINSYAETNAVFFYSISTKPSKNCFLDGQNMHVSIKPPEEWVRIIKEYSTGKVFINFNGK